MIGEYITKPKIHPVFERLNLMCMNPVISGNVIRFDCPGISSENKHSALFRIGKNDTDEGEFFCPICGDLTNIKIMDRIGLTRCDLRHCARVQIDDTNQHQISDAISEALRSTKLIFRFGEKLVKVRKEDKVFVVLNADDCLDMVSRILIFTDDKGHIKKMKKIWVNNFLYKSEHKEFEAVIGVLSHPVIDKQGVIEFCLGYDKNNQTFNVYDINKFNKVEFNGLTKSDAIQSDERLDKLLSKIPVKSKNDLAAIKCAMSTAVMRVLFDLAPEIGLTGNVFSETKSNLSQIFSLLMRGRSVRKIYCSENVLENIKLITSRLSIGEMCICHDGGFWRSRNDAILKTLINTGGYELNGLGFVKNKALLICEEEDCVVTENQALLSIMINLSEDKIKEETDDKLARLVNYINEHLEEVVSDVIVVTAAYIQNDCPIVDKETLYPFHEWNKYCRLPWVWISGDEPVPQLVRVRNLKSKNADAVKKFCKILCELFGGRGIKSREIIEFMNTERFSDGAQYLLNYFNLMRVDLSSECIGKHLALLKKSVIPGYDVSVGREDNTNVYFISESSK